MGNNTTLESLFAKQHGAISRSQALSAGLTVRQVDYRVATKQWAKLDWGVYALPTTRNSHLRKLWVACLAGGAQAVASHQSAAALIGLAKAPERPQITVPRTVSGRVKGATVHHADVPAVDRCVASGVPSTTPARVLVDCADVMSYKALCRVVDVALAKGITTPAKVLAAAARAPGRRGAGRLTEAMRIWVEGAPPGSPAEARVLRWMARSGVRPPVRQLEVFDGDGVFVARVDFGWPEDGVLLEYDGEEFHTLREALSDAQREVLVEELGYRVVRADRHDFRASATRLLGLLPGVAGSAA